MALDDDGLTLEVERRNALQRTLIDRVARKAADEAGRDAGRRAARGYLLLMVVLLIGSFFYQRTVDHRIHTALNRGCERLDTLRVQEANRGFQTLWKAFYLSRERARGLAAAADDDEVRETNQKAVRQLGEFIEVLKWTPSTDCPAFADDPSGYKAPVPQPFTKKYLDLGVTPE